MLKNGINLCYADILLLEIYPLKKHFGNGEEQYGRV